MEPSGCPLGSAERLDDDCGSNRSEAANETTNGTFERSAAAVSFYISMYWIVVLFGLVGNCIIIAAIITVRHMRSVTNYLLLNLAIADISVLLLCAPTGILELVFEEQWLLGSFMCSFMAVAENTAAETSIFTLLAIAFERYFIVNWPLQSKERCTKRFLRCLICGVWAASVAISLPHIALTRHDWSSSDSARCSITVEDTGRKVFYCVFNLLFFFVPFGAMFLIYLRILLCLVRSTRPLLKTHVVRMSSGRDGSATCHVVPSTALERIDAERSEADDAEDSNASRGADRRPSTPKALAASPAARCGANGPNGLSGPGGPGGPGGPNDPNGPNGLLLARNSSAGALSPSLLRSRRYAIYMLMVIIAIMFICLSPFRVFVFIFAVSTEGPDQALMFHIIHIMRLMYYANSSCNILVYAFMSSKFRKALSIMFCKRNRRR